MSNYTPAVMGKYSFVVVMECGRLVLWTGRAEDAQHAEGLAQSYAQERYDGQIYDTARRPVKEAPNHDS